MSRQDILLKRINYFFIHLKYDNLYEKKVGGTVMTLITKKQIDSLYKKVGLNPNKSYTVSDRLNTEPPS